MFFNVRKTAIGRPFNMPFTQRHAIHLLVRARVCGYMLWLFATPEMLSHRISFVQQNRNTQVQLKRGARKEATKNQMEMRP